MKETIITLRPIPPSSAQTLANILQDESIKKTYMVPDLTADAALQMATRICALSCKEDRYVRGIYLNETLVGLLNDVDISDGSIELGWVIAPKYQNRGYATEAVRSAIDDLFSKGYSQVLAGAFAENTASIRVMEKAGMVLQDKTVEIEYRGKSHKCVYYARRRQ